VKGNQDSKYDYHYLVDVVRHVVKSMLGDIGMLSLRSYVLSIAGAVNVVIPCLSCSGFC
jgi:hypothetical protein